MHKENSADIYRTWMSLAAFVIIVAGVKAAASIVILFLLSVFIATVSSPALFWLEKFHVSRIIAFFMVLFVVLTVLFGFGYILSSSVDSFLANTPQYQVKIIELVDDTSDFLNKRGVEVSKSNLETMFNPSNILNFAGIFLKSLTAILSDSFIIFLGVTFILFEISSFRTKISLLTKISNIKDNPFDSFGKKLNSYLVVKTITSFITALLIALGLSILGIDFALLLGLIAFLLNYIPSIGSVLAAIPALLVTLIGIDVSNIFWVIVLYLTVNIIIGNIIEPRYMGKVLGLSVVVIFFSLIFWGWIFGPVGMFLAIPLSMSIKIALESHPSTKSIAILLSSVHK